MKVIFLKDCAYVDPLNPSPPAVYYYKGSGPIEVKDHLATQMIQSGDAKKFVESQPIPDALKKPTALQPPISPSGEAPAPWE